jgi:hypothetical protein
MLSPRTKATKINYTSSENQIIQHFIKSNLKLFLRLIASDINKAENAQLNATEFNALRVVFKVKNQGSKPLSQHTPFFQGKEQVKVKVDYVVEWLTNNISNSMPGSDPN